MLIRRQLQVEHTRREQDMLRRMQESREREARWEKRCDFLFGFRRLYLHVFYLDRERERQMAEQERLFKERERELREREYRERQRREQLERELREREAREREIRERERRLKEQHERELREREAKSMRERELREKVQVCICLFGVDKWVVASTSVTGSFVNGNTFCGKCGISRWQNVAECTM